MNEVNGWKCPECGHVFAPHVDECKYCGGESAVITQPQPAPYTPTRTVPYKSLPHVWPYREDYDWWRRPLITCETKTISTGSTQEPLTVLY